MRHQSVRREQRILDIWTLYCISRSRLPHSITGLRTKMTLYIAQREMAIPWGKQNYKRSGPKPGLGKSLCDANGCLISIFYGSGPGVGACTYKSITAVICTSSRYFPVHSFFFKFQGIMKFTTVFAVLAGAAAVSARPGVETNAQRLARGLPPLPPVRRGTPVAGELNSFLWRYHYSSHST